MKRLEASQSVQEFSEFGLAPSLLLSLQRQSILKPTTIQSQALPVLMSGQDLIAVAETGSGKTLAYALPLMHLLRTKPGSRALVLAPTREVALQISAVFEALSADEPISSCVVIGGERGNRQDKQMRKNPSLVVATPGRLNDLLRNNKLLLKGLSALVIDEADIMLDMGFSSQLKEIHSTLRGERQTAMFSASFSPKIEIVAKIFMTSESVVMLRPSETQKPVASLKQRVVFLAPGMKNQRLQDEINLVSGSVLVFAANQESCESIGLYLQEYSHKSDYVHGGLEQSIRTKILNKFRECKIRILVTTDLLSRGLDVADLELVVNFDLPLQSEDFVHRIGRTARMGRAGFATTFVTPFDFRLYKQIKPYLVDAEEVSLDASFKFLGDTTNSVAIPKANLKRGTQDVLKSEKKKKKYGTSNKRKK